jgi:hypothetical protein
MIKPTAVTAITNTVKPSLVLMSSRMEPALDFTLAPILFGFALHSGRVRIFDLHPMRGSTRAVERAKPLADNTLAAEPAGFAKYNLAVILEMFIEHDTQI